MTLAEHFKMTLLPVPVVSVSLPAWPKRWSMPFGNIGSPRHQTRQHHVRAAVGYREGDRLWHCTNHRFDKTKTGLVLGNAQFHVTRATGGQEGGRTFDLYSLGVTLFQLLAGVLPFRGDSMAELMYKKIANEEAPDIRVIVPELPSDRLAHGGALALSKRPGPVTRTAIAAGPSRNRKMAALLRRRPPWA